MIHGTTVTDLTGITAGTAPGIMTIIGIVRTTAAGIGIPGITDPGITPAGTARTTTITATTAITAIMAMAGTTVLIGAAVGDTRPTTPGQWLLAAAGKEHSLPVAALHARHLTEAERPVLQT